LIGAAANLEQARRSACLFGEGKVSHERASRMQTSSRPSPFAAPAGDVISFTCHRSMRRGGQLGFGRNVMQNRSTVVALAVALASAASAVAVAQNAPAPGASAAPRPGLTILEFKPAMDDLMTMLVQPRHIKLYYAGQAKNWRLAGFELNELRGALARIGRTIPTYRNIGVDTAVGSIFADSIKSVDAAIKAGDSAQFATAYGEMTAACNACHTGMEHSFLVIKVPDGAIYPDQEFKP
jgi:hypothetical protein